MFLWARYPVGLCTGISVRANVPRRARPYMVTSLTRKHILLGPYRRHMPRVLWGSYGGGVSHERSAPVGEWCPAVEFRLYSKTNPPPKTTP